MKRRAFKMYWTGVDSIMYYVECFVDGWSEIRDNKFLGALTMVMAVFHAMITAAMWWVRSL